jgi:hypothetical protein
MFDELAKDIHKNAVEKGFWDRPADENICYKTNDDDCF